MVEYVAAATGVQHRDFFARSRLKQNVADARQLAMYLAHVLLGLTLTQVGGFFGRDRTTVAHACSRIEDERDAPDRDAAIQTLEDYIETARRNRSKVISPAQSAGGSHALV